MTLNIAKRLSCEDYDRATSRSSQKNGASVLPAGEGLCVGEQKLLALVSSGNRQTELRFILVIAMHLRTPKPRFSFLP
jgi:hypothetical protein